MPHKITVKDKGDQGPNEYKLVFGGDHKPTATTHRGATKNSGDRVYQNNQGDWVAEGTIYGGADGWTYNGDRKRMAFTNKGNVEIAINDKPWTDATKFDSTESLGGGGGGGGDDDGGIVDAVTDAFDGDSGGGSSGESSSVPVSGGSSASNESPGLGGVARPMYSQGDIEMHVGRNEDYKSLQSAFNDVPHFVLHDVDIYVHGRTEDRNTAHIGHVWILNNVHFCVDGSDGGIVNNGGVNIFIVGKMDHIQVENLKLEFISQCAWARFENCDMDGNGKAAFSGKMAGKMLVDCDVGSGNDRYAIWSIGTEKVEARGCTLRGDDAAIRGASASAHVLNNCNIRAPQKMAGGADDVFLGGKRMN